MDNNLITNIMLGRVDYAQHIRLFGHNPDVDSGTVPEDIWHGGGVYPGQPTTGNAETVTVDSASNSDEGAVVRVYGLDSNYALANEDVTLDATGTAVTDGTFRRVYRIEVITPATGQTSNVGAITANHTTTTANVFAIIPAGNGVGEGACFTIPAGYTGYLINMGGQPESDAAGNITVLGLWSRKANGSVLVTERLSTLIGRICMGFPVGLKFPALTDLRLRVLSTGDDTPVAGVMDFILIKD